MQTTFKKKTIIFLRTQGIYIMALFLSLIVVFASRGFFTRLVVLVQKKADSTTQINLENDTALITQLTDENKTFKEMLGRSDVQKGILAHVVTPPNRSLYDTMLIDAGSKNQIVVGSTVYGLGDVALGKIVTVYDHSALVSLFSTSGNTSAGSVVGSGISVTLIGRGSGEYEIRMPRDIHFAQGDVIAEQSANTKILAVVESVQADSRDPFSTIRAKAPVNLQALPWVIIK
jgi:cell shape-determining protein MreC